MVELNHTYTHYKNKQNYITKDFCKIQVNEKWVEAIIYTPENSNELFVRSLMEFKLKFTKN